MLERLDRFVAQPRVDIDSGAASARLREVVEQLDRLDRFRATPTIDLDGYALARAQIESLQRQLDQLSRTRATPSVGGINALGNSASSASGRTHGLRNALLLLAPAAIPLGGAALAGVAAFSGALGAAAAGAGIFGAAMKTNLSGVSEAVKNFDKQGMAALDGLDAGQKKVALGVIQLKSQWKAAADSVRPQTYQVATNVMGGLSNALTALRPLLTASADAFVRLSAGFERATKGRTFKDFSDFLARQAGPAIDTFGKALGDLGATFAHVLQAFEPLIRPAEDALLRFTGGIRKWSESLKTNDGFQKFLAYIRDTGPKVASALKSLWNGFTALVAALAPLGPPLLRVVGFIGDLVKQIADSKGFHDFVEGLKRVINAVVDFLTKIKDSKQFKSFIDSVGKLALAIGKLFEKIAGDKQTVQLFKDALGALALVLGPLAKLIGFVADHMTAFKVLTIGIWGPIWALSKVVEVLGWAFSHLGGFLTRAVGDIVNWAQSAAGAVRRFTVRAAGDIANWAQAAAGGIRRFAVRALGDIVNWAQAAAGGVRRFTTRALSDIRNWASSAAGAVGRFASSAASHIASFASSAVGHIANFASRAYSLISNAMGRMASSVASGVGRVVGFMAALPGRIAGALGGLASRLFSIGRDALTGLWNGLKSVADGIIGWVQDMAGRIKGAFSSILGIHSPSVVFHGYGQNIMQGLHRGLTAGAPAAIAAVQDIANRLATAGDLSLNGSVSVGASGAGGQAFGGSRRGAIGGGVGSGPTYILNGVGPDYIRELNERDRQRAFNLGA